MPRIGAERHADRIVEVWLTAAALVNDSGGVYAIATTERKVQSEP